MAKRKKKSSKARKPKALTTAVLERRITDLFSKQVTARLDAKTIIRKLRITNSKDSVQHCLDKLVDQGQLSTTNKGKYKWNRAAKRTARKNERQSNNIATGTVDLTRSGAAYIICEDLEKDIFVPAHKTMGSLKGDTVEVSWFASKKGRPEGRIVKILTRKNDHFIGTLVITSKYAFVVPDHQGMETDILLDPKKLPKEAEDGAKVVVKVEEWHTNNKSNPKGIISTYLGQEGGNDLEMKTILVQKGFNLTFPPEVLKENEKIEAGITAKEISKRRDMRSITTFTIDPATAKDFDDALSIQLLDNGRYEVGIHIADVTHYVRPDSALDKEAASRTTSVYLVDRVLPMLPEKLSNGVCSLRPQEEKLTFSAVFELDLSGKIHNEWFGKTVIFSDRRFTYEEAQERLENKEGDYATELDILNQIAHALRKKRFKSGAIDFESPEVRFKLDEKGHPIDVYLKTRKDSNMLIEDFMLLANRRVGALMAGLQQKLGFIWPMIYRIHDEPDLEKVGNFADFAKQLGYPMNIKDGQQVKRSFTQMLQKAAGKPESKVLQQLAIRTMAKAVYSNDNIGHYGLGFETYSHFTSPIRRYADVLAHRILFDYLSNNNKRMKAAKLEELCKHISKKERDAMEAERESIKYKQAEYLEAQVGKFFEATISGISDHGVYATLKANFCEGMIRYDKMYMPFRPDEYKFKISTEDITYKMGDSIMVKVLNADRYKRQVDLELVDEELYEEIQAVAEHSIQRQKKEQQLKASSSHEKAPIKAAAEKKVAPSNSSTNKTNPQQLVQKPIQKHQEAQLFDNLLPMAQQIYEDSDVKKIAEKKKVTWSYELAPAVPYTNGVLLLTFQPEAVPNKAYTIQEQLPLKTAAPRGSLRAFIKTYFEQQPCSKGYFSPLRALDEQQLSPRDLELSVPLFKTFVSLMRPTTIVAFSSRIIGPLQDAGLLKQLDKKDFQAGKRNISVYKTLLVVNGLDIPLAIVPTPSSRISKNLKSDCWNWALNE